MTSADDELLAEMRARLERTGSVVGQAEQRLERVAAMGDQLKTVEATASSPDQAVTVVAGPGGSVRGIRLTEHSRRLSR